MWKNYMDWEEKMVADSSKTKTIKQGKFIRKLSLYLKQKHYKTILKYANNKTNIQINI